LNRRGKRNSVFAALFLVTASLSIVAAAAQIDVCRIIDKATAESIGVGGFNQDAALEITRAIAKKILPQL